MKEDAETHTYIVDMQQGPKFTSPGPCVPTLTKHSRLVSISDRGIKMWTPLEHLFSMGEAIKPGVGDPDYPCLFQDLLESGGLSPQEIVKMSGDATSVKKSSGGSKKRKSISFTALARSRES